MGGVRLSRVALAYNARTSDDEAEAEHFAPEYVDRLLGALEELGHEAVPVEMTGAPVEVAGRLLDARPDIVLNLAEGVRGPWREAAWPILYEALGLPYTGSGAPALFLGLDKRLLEDTLERHGVRVPRGGAVTQDHPGFPDGLQAPVLLKPNYEGSSKGIHQDSVHEDLDEATQAAHALLEEYPQGIDVEEFVPGRELNVSYLEGAGDGGILPTLEYRMPDQDYPMMDYETKRSEGKGVEEVCPAPLAPGEGKEVIAAARRSFAALKVRDLARADMRLRDDGTPFLIEVNPLPGLRDVSPFVRSAAAAGLSLPDVLGHVLDAAAMRCAPPSMEAIV